MIQNSTDNDLPVLANDSDPDDGQTLDILSVGTTDAGGAASINPNGQTIVYTPPAGFIGTDRFTYTVSDGHGGIAQSMVTVQVMAPIPALNASFQANLSIFINGERRPDPPANIGVMSPGAAQTIIAPIHTEAADGRIHIEPTSSGPSTQSVTVNDFFTTWQTNAGAAGNNPNSIFTANQVLDHVRAVVEVVRTYVNGLPLDRPWRPTSSVRRIRSSSVWRRSAPPTGPRSCRLLTKPCWQARRSSFLSKASTPTAHRSPSPPRVPIQTSSHHTNPGRQSQPGDDCAGIWTTYIRAAGRPRAGHYVEHHRVGQ